MTISSYYNVSSNDWWHLNRWHFSKTCQQTVFHPVTVSPFRVDRRYIRWLCELHVLHSLFHQMVVSIDVWWRHMWRSLGYFLFNFMHDPWCRHVKECVSMCHDGVLVCQCLPHCHCFMVCSRQEKCLSVTCHCLTVSSYPTVLPYHPTILYYHIILTFCITFPSYPTILPYYLTLLYYLAILPYYLTIL